jgi:hypothetical protein
MLEEQRKAISKKIKQPSQTKHQGGLKEYRICCYNCKHCKVKKKNLGYCYLDKNNPKKIISVRTTNCKQHFEIELLECELCGKFYRALSYHVQVHGITLAEYKLLYGYNSSTGLVCSHTSKLFAKYDEANLQKLREHSPLVKGNKIQMKKGERIVVEEARINMRRAKIDELSNKPRRVGPNKGKKLKPLSEEHKQKISKSMKEFLKNNPRKLRQLLKNAKYGRSILQQQKSLKND